MEKRPHEKRQAKLFRDELDFAFFAARLGWSRSDYEDTTPVERMFIRKEMEAVTVERSSLIAKAVQVAMANAYGKRKKKLWTKKRKKQAPAVSRREVRAIQDRFRQEAPWTPWQRKEVPNGRLHP